MWFYNFALTYLDEYEGKARKVCGLTVGSSMKDAVERLTNMYGDFWDFHIDFCGEDNEDVLTKDGLADHANWRLKYADHTEA